MAVRESRILDKAGALPSLRWKPIGTGKRSLEWTPQPATVAAKRRAMGIPKVIRTKIDWQNPDVLRQLGTMPDDDLGERLGVNAETVRTRRTAAGIAP